MLKTSIALAAVLASGFNDKLLDAATATDGQPSREAAQRDLARGPGERAALQRSKSYVEKKYEVSIAPLKYVPDTSQFDLRNGPGERIALMRSHPSEKTVDGLVPRTPLRTDEVQDLKDTMKRIDSWGMRNSFDHFPERFAANTYQRLSAINKLLENGETLTLTLDDISVALRSAPKGTYRWVEQFRDKLY